MAIDLCAFATECDEVVAARAARVAAQRREDAIKEMRDYQLSEQKRRIDAHVAATLHDIDLPNS
jgi:hypothetical protein